MDKLFGFSEKYLYQTWCIMNRFEFFSELRKVHRPKGIICTGNSYLRDFFMFFGGSSEQSGRIKAGTLETGSTANKHSEKPRRYYWVAIDDVTTLFVIPFFSGSYGLNSNHLLQEMGGVIRREGR